MKSWSVRQRIIVGFSAVILVMIVLSALAYFRLRGIAVLATALDGDSVPGLYLVGRLQAVSIENHLSTEQHVAAHDPEQMRQIMAYIAQKTQERLDLLKQYEPTVVTAKEVELYEATKAALAQYMVVRQRVLQLSEDLKTKAQAEAVLRDQLASLYDKLQESLQNEVDYDKSSAFQDSVQIRKAVTDTQRGILVSLLLGLVFAVATGYVLMAAISSLIRDVQQSGIQVNSSATEIAATAQEQLSTANEVAATTSEIGATSKEISATSKELVQTMKDVTKVAEKTASLAGSGQTGLTRMKATMQQITEASAAINSRLAVLSEKAGNISNVVTTITKVADQTNLLSLNAAIEAEKAGDYGRGFAVVATEIRRLADQTAVATSDIEQTVKEMQSAAAAGVMGMDKFSEEVRRGVEVVHQVGEELSQIIQQVQTLTPNFESVGEGMQSQSLGAQQISESLSQLSDAAKQTVESLRQSNLAIDQLNDAARRLQSGVARFAFRT